MPRHKQTKLRSITKATPTTKLNFPPLQYFSSPGSENKWAVAKLQPKRKKTASSFSSSRFNPSLLLLLLCEKNWKWSEFKKINLAFSKDTNRIKKLIFFSFIFQFYLLLLTEVILQTFYNILFRFQLLFFPTRSREKWKKIPICCLYIFVYYIFRSQTEKCMKSWFILLFFYAKKFNFFSTVATRRNFFFLDFSNSKILQQFLQYILDCTKEFLEIIQILVYMNFLKIISNIRKIQEKKAWKFL